MQIDAVPARRQRVGAGETEGQLVARDPDYDIVRYRYRWTVAGRAVRSVWSAGLSDELSRDSAKPGQRVVCAVTPSDGKLSARPTAVSATAA